MASISASTSFRVGASYSREDIKLAVVTPGEKPNAKWRNGYLRHNGAYYVLCSMERRGIRPAFKRLRGNLLAWRAREGSHSAQAQITEMRQGTAPIYFFCRPGLSGEFTFSGYARVVRFRDDPTVRAAVLTLAFSDKPSVKAKRDERLFVEGERRLVAHVSNEASRSSALIKALQNSGRAWRCEGCESAGEQYGCYGANIMEAHHLRPIAGGPRQNGLKDLTLLCANCHRVIHQLLRRDPKLATLAGLRETIAL